MLTFPSTSETRTGILSTPCIYKKWLKIPKILNKRILFLKDKLWVSAEMPWDFSHPHCSLRHGTGPVWNPYTSRVTSDGKVK